MAMALIAILIINEVKFRCLLNANRLAIKNASVMKYQSKGIF
jgi:hypothetical protein